MPGGMVVRLPRVKMCFLTFWVEHVENRGISLHFRICRKLCKLVKNVTKNVFSARESLFEGQDR